MRRRGPCPGSPGSSLIRISSMRVAFKHGPAAFRQPWRLAIPGDPAAPSPRADLAEGIRRYWQHSFAAGRESRIKAATAVAVRLAFEDVATMRGGGLPVLRRPHSPATGHGASAEVAS